ncbi:MAG: ribonuclease domain-containing protein [Gallionella sp.]|nr:ribonuclease domain-containing protein [Gallionella sp.]
MVRLLRAWLVVLLAVLWLPAGAQAQAHQPVQGAHDGLEIISVADLPVEAHKTLRAIKQGGPFASPRDGAAFRNYERVLPKHPRGYYREYTVKTPGAHNRGMRRIISGGLNEYYYTADHYKTFKRILE